ncbi:MULTISPECIES: ribonuclease T2 family protein [Marinovum]|uniref:Ribonuclease T2 n=1 Tax=Marinovum algicola TaxID=42444 RepID=A0A975WAV9_9RHOB|nr:MULTISPECIES: ribonuclease T2 [Marinovum]AKO95543.1 Ribonuclease I [Marinovum algicola DG 898]MDD9741518.1 ribonuclease T2 [Marinovum sp. SP66]MDD9743787.1 ribonuclease T2 [Marinovum sp. PR37]SEJ65080.1 ribonuclease T2 [Marinovum algicola]SLN53199.1 Ribonuclease I precursor [Marinovum algicola]
MRVIALCAVLCLPLMARADGEKAGDFDYWVLALSWSPNWCEIEGDAKGSEQCDPRHDFGWTLHGLWPQYQRGWPAYCPTAERPPSRAMTRDMSDIMGTAGLAWHQWKKHGSCSGLSAAGYFEASRAAYEAVVRPEVFRKLDRPVRLPAAVVEEAFLKDNPALEADGITVTCRDGRIQEARICLSLEMEPVPCGRDVVRDCTLQDALFAPVR